MKNRWVIAMLVLVTNMSCGSGSKEGSSTTDISPSFPSLPSIFEPCPSVESIQEKIRDTPPESSFAHLFRAGERCGLQHDLPRLIEMGSQLGRDNALVFLDGAAHTHAFDPRQVSESLQAVQRDVPLEYRTLFLKGVALHQALAHGDQPQRMLDFARTFQKVTGEPIPFDGIRVGLQRKMGDDMAKAVSIAMQYPAAYHRPLLEELGWRATVHHNPETVLGRAAAQSIPTPTRCIFVRGAIRGWTLRQPLSTRSEWTTLHRSIRPALQACPSEGRMGLAWAFIDRFQTHAEVNEAMQRFHSISQDDQLKDRLKALWPIRTHVNVWTEMK